MYMSGKHAAIEKVFLRLPEKARIPAVYIALCNVGKIRKSAIENRLSAMKLFAGTNAGRAAREIDTDEDEDEDEIPRVRAAPAKVKRPERAAESRPKRSWEEDFEAALKADEEVSAKARAEKAAKKSKDDDDEEEDV